MNLHVEQHNQHADLQEYRVAPLAENLKTLWFQNGIRDPSLNAVKASINANRANFTDYDSVKDAYVEFKCTQAPTHDPKTRQVISVAPSGCALGLMANLKTVRKVKRVCRVKATSETT